MELEIRNLSKRYGKKQALSNVSCKLNDGVYGLLGANGAGKSTLMNIITGNIEADEGEVLLDGKNILKSENQREFREYLGYMPQFPIQYRGFTVLDFLFYMASLRGISKKKAKEKIDELLDMLALTEVRNKKMTALSGGMKQRLMLAQSVIGNPKVLILDEPLAGLDEKTQDMLVDFLQSFHKAGKTLITITHNRQLAETIGTRFACMNEEHELKMRS